MTTKIKITDSATRCIIDIEGVIGVPEQSQFDSPAERVATYERFREQIDKIAQVSSAEVLVNIRSTGGDVNDALLIHDALVALDAHVTTCCYGYTASAATIIAQAADEGCRQISPSAFYLVHCSSALVEGNASELAEQQVLLRKTDERIAALYAARSGRGVEEFEALMAENGGRGRWLSPDEALEAGLVDVVLEKKRGVLRDVIEKVNAWFGLDGGATLPPMCDINILHGPMAAQRHRSCIALDEGQRRVTATQTRPVEDPAIEEVRQTANEAAYASDVRRCFGA